VAFQEDSPPSFDEALRVAKKILSKNRDLISRGVIETEAEQLVMAAYRQATGTKLNRVDFYTRMRDAFPPQAAHLVLVWCNSRAEGKLLQHFTGVQVFLDHEYQVGPDVLVPRPETEVLLVSAAAELLGNQVTPSLGMEIGIGSGILSIELLVRFPGLRMFASEVSPEARKRAQENALQILGDGPKGQQRLKILPALDPSDVWEAFSSEVTPGSADFVISNPPYLIQGEGIEPEVAMYEPHVALFAPAKDPLYFYRKIAEQASNFLKPRGFAFAEMPHERASEIGALFSHASWDVHLIEDLNQRQRVLVGRLRK
jgi:release factor glutamine methyltransferase